ncbi:hypothetical protein B296_00051022 [Ensete ventricosum]|uniref:Uncharacterized protein n=1 Tax=Ensete ventricosum TaxID=4639 RepID=A0A426X042_ENSVE|nr:hypothetical protein B296_00051022 [Ensete ventricosum]
MVEKLARLGPTHVRKLVCVDQQVVERFERDWLGLLANVPQWVYSVAHLGLLLLEACRGILHECLVGVRVLDMTSLIVKSMSRPR